MGALREMRIKSLMAFWYSIFLIIAIVLAAVYHFNRESEKKEKTMEEIKIGDIASIEDKLEDLKLQEKDELIEIYNEIKKLYEVIGELQKDQIILFRGYVGFVTLCEFLKEKKIVSKQEIMDWVKNNYEEEEYVKIFDIFDWME